MISNCDEELERLRNMVSEQLKLGDLENMLQTENLDDEDELKVGLMNSGIIEELSNKLLKDSTILTKNINLKKSRNMTVLENPALDLNTQKCKSLTVEQLTKFKKGMKYLCFEIIQGRQFMDVTNTETSKIQAHAYFNGQRYSTEIKELQEKKSFAQEFYFELDYSDLNVLVDLDTPIHICCTKSDFFGVRYKLGTGEIDWRLLLTENENSESNSSSHSVQIKDLDNPQILVGILEVKMKILSNCDLLLAKESLKLHISTRIFKTHESERMFYLFAKQWWDDYLQIRPDHATRLVKFIATGEFGRREVVTNFVFPIQSDSLSTPNQAAQFVSLFNCEKSRKIGDVGYDLIGIFFDF